MINKKVCTKCGEDKSVNEFWKNKRYSDGLQNQCKCCFKISNKKYREDNKDKLKTYYKSYREDNKDKITNGAKKYYQKNKQTLSNYQKEYNKKNKELVKQKKKKYREENEEKVKIYSKKWREENKEKRRVRESKRLKSDVLYKLTCSIRKIMYDAFRKKSFRNTSKTANILGCTFEQFKSHIEVQFEGWMNWDNHGKYTGRRNETWQYDHIIPLASATTEEEVIKLNHYTNFQPLCSFVNQNIKRDKLNYKLNK